MKNYLEPVLKSLFAPLAVNQNYKIPKMMRRIAIANVFHKSNSHVFPLIREPATLIGILNQ